MTTERDRPEVVVSLRGITKRFGSLAATNGVDLDLREGEVHALLGENGAGKTTLMHVLSGVYEPDEGEIIVRGRRVRFRSPDDASRAGIGMVHQHFRLIDRFTVAENVHVGWREAPRLVSRAALERRTRELSERYSVPVDASARIGYLSVGEQQRVEILRALSRHVSVLILDEPTAVLTPNEVRRLFVGLRVISEGGTTVVFITHKLDEVLEIADRVTVMRAGRRVGTLDRDVFDRATLVRMMVGGDVPQQTEVDDREPGEVVLAAEAVSAADDRGLPALREVDLVVRAGEIVGVAGVAGNGQRELSEVLTGLRRASSGRVLVAGKDLTGGRPREFIRAGVGHIPEDRWATGLVPLQPVWANAILKAYRADRLRRGPLLRRPAARQFASELAQSVRILLRGLDEPIRHLSGGNAQRLLTGREIGSAARALVAVHPTRGLDVAAAEHVRAALLEARRNGIAVLLVSEDLDEVIALSDRVVVFSGGRIRGEFRRGATDRQRIGLLMGGVEAA